MSDDKQGKGSDGDRLLYCSFCGKSQHEVRKLIAGPSVFICDECVELCNDIIREEIQEKPASGSGSTLPTPHDIVAQFDTFIADKIQQDTERDHFLSSEEAKEYGLIDAVLTERVKTSEPEAISE